MTGTRAFHIGDILTITTGRLVSPDHMDGVYRILNWMTGDNLFTHQLPRACAECAPSLRQQFPDLAAVEVPAELSGETDVTAWLEAQIAIYGDVRQVEPLAAEDHTHMDPLAELRQLRPDVPVTLVVLDEDGAAS
jgi:hypothetical protein